LQNTEECNLQVAVFCLTGITILEEHAIELMNVNQSTAFSFAAWKISPLPFFSKEEVLLGQSELPDCVQIRWFYGALQNY